MGMNAKGKHMLPFSRLSDNVPAKNLASNELVVTIAVPGNQPPVVASSFPIEVGLAEVGSPKPVYLALALTILLIAVQRVERARRAGEDQSIVLLDQTEDRDGAG
jgi:hypothetical protein